MKKIVLATTIVFLLVGLISPLAQAQEGAITLKSKQVTNQASTGRPDGVLFQVTAETIAPAQIKEIRLEMRVKGSNRSSYAYLEFTPATVVEGKHLLKTTGAQYKPPGTLIEYYFIISDTERRTLETPKETHLYLDNRFPWEHLSEGLMEVYYYGPIKARAETIVKAGARTTDKMGNLLGIKVTEPLRIIAYNSARDMIPAQPFESRTSERELLLEGVTFAEYGTLLMIAGVDRPDGVASHEITHVLVGKLTENAFVDIPAWLNEGLAEYGNINRSSTYDSLVSDAKARNRLLPLRNMQAPPGITEDRLLMYGQGYAVIKYMIDTYGEDKFRALFAAFNKGLRINDALRSVYGFDQDGLDNAWRGSLGLPPVEKAAPVTKEPVPAKEAPAAESKGVAFNFTPIIIIVAVAIVALVLGIVLISRTKPRSGAPSS